MLGKLLKYEMKAYGRILVPIYIAVLALGALLGISVRFLPTRMTYNFVFVFLGIVYVLLLVAVVVVTTIMAISRYYNNLLGREGYLMFSLPVRSGTLMVAKTLAALIWTASGTIVGFASVFTTFMAAKFRAPDFEELWKEIGFVLDRARPYAGYVAVWILLMILALVVIIVRVYAAVSIGSQWGAHRLPGSILVYVGFKAIETILAAVFNASDAIREAFDSLIWSGKYTYAANGLANWRLQVLVLVLILIEIAVYWLLAWYFTDRKLNLA